MNGLTGMEKFSHLEDKIYLTVEYVKKLREERESIVAQLEAANAEKEDLAARNERLESQIEKLDLERDAIRLKVETMLEALIVIDPEVAAAIGWQPKN